MKWSLPLSIGAVFVASLAYLHLVPEQKADGTACCVSTKSEALACCSEGAGCCTAGAACCETASAKTEGCGDALRCLDVVEHETVDSILARASAAMQLEEKDIWVSRLGDDAAAPEQILRTNFLEMSEGIDPATNYQIIPYHENDRH